MITYPLGVSTLTTRVLEAGAGNHAVVFVHGAGARADRWRENFPGIASAGRHTYAFDLPGHGFAVKDPNYPHSAPAYAEFLADFLSGLSFSRLTVVGTSIGAHAAALCATNGATAIDDLVLVGAIGIVPLGSELRRAMAARIRDTSPEGTAAKLGRLLGGSALASADRVTEEVLINNSPGALASLQRLAQYIEEKLDDDAVADPLEAVAKRVRVLTVWGGQDRSVPMNIAREAIAAVPSARSVVLEQAGHVSYLQFPDVFNQHLDDFLNAPA
jgi:2-hydroxy-6-oxonona-2,4-dienedioate hydrolase